MSLHAKAGGTWATVQEAFVKRSGSWTQVQEIYVKNAGAWALVYAAEVVAVVAANVNNLNIQNLFSAADWASTTKKKRVVVNPGVTIGDAARSGFALRTNTGRGSSLTIVNNGEIQGFAGNPNSGGGGTALYVDQAGVTIVNNWAIRGGGGAGGVGGVGGAGGTGYYNTTSRDPASGWASSSQYGYKLQYQDLSGQVVYWYSLVWAGSTIWQDSAKVNSPTAAATRVPASLTVGAYTYTHSDFSVARTWLVPVYVAGHGGGAGGTGGYGQGYGRARSNGLGGAAGGNNGGNSGTGGTGGTGGNGGTWGAAGTAGNTGGTGATGNYAGGLAGGGGGGGGPAGAAIGGVARTVQNFNTINGAY